MIWVGTEKGLRVLNEITQKFIRFHVDENLKRLLMIPALHLFSRDKQGILWFGRWGQGLVRYNPKDHSINHFYSIEGDSSSISSNHVGQGFGRQIR